MKNELHDLLALQLLQFHRPSSYNWQKYQDARKAFEQRLDAADARIAELESELVKQVRGSGVVFDICLWESIKRDGGNVTLIDEGTKQSEVK